MAQPGLCLVRHTFLNTALSCVAVCEVFHCALAIASAPVSVPLVVRAEQEATMFAMLIGVGALFLAVSVSAPLDRRWSHFGGAANTRV